MAIKSKVKLAEAIKQFNGNGDGNVSLNISYETYGRKTFAYVHSSSPDERRHLEAYLSTPQPVLNDKFEVDFVRGFQVNRDYWPGSNVSEVRVSYFKAKGWNE